MLFSYLTKATICDKLESVKAMTKTVISEITAQRNGVW